jgi:hypothetical protein
MWKAQLQNIGRGKVTKTVEVQDMDDIAEEVSQYLMSNDIYLTYTGNNIFIVTVGVAERVVGKVHILDWGEGGIPAYLFAESID